MYSTPAGTSRQPTFVPLAAALVLIGLQIAHADETATAQQDAQRLAVGVCGTCHGPRGNSEQPKFPRLAGQSADYLGAQLRNFRDQKRADPDAIGYMWGMAAPLRDPAIDALAKYYAAQQPKVGKSRDPALVQRGHEIYVNGITAEGVPACVGCHGPDAHGQAQYPRLAGQHAQYMLKQLASFQSNMRDVAVMHGIAQNLRASEMESVAAYLEGQP